MSIVYLRLNALDSHANITKRSDFVHVLRIFDIFSISRGCLCTCLLNSVTVCVMSTKLFCVERNIVNVTTGCCLYF